MPIDPKLVQWQDPAGPAIDPAAIQWETPGNKFDLRGEMYDRAMNYDPTNAQAGMIRGAGSIGATVLRPFESGQQNAQRRTDMDAALRDLMRADPSSTQYQTNKLLAEVAGTSGVGGLVAKGVRMIPGAARALPTLLPAIESGGMAANGARGIYGVLNRIAGGAVNGAATAGLANPEDAGAGMMIGGALPPAVQLVGGAGQAVGSRIGSKAINPQLAETARQSVEAGYVIPPNMVKPSLGSQVIESISGKQATQQIASVKNSQTTEKLVRNALGIADDIPCPKGRWKPAQDGWAGLRRSRATLSAGSG